MTRRCRGDRGSEAIEFAVLAPVVLLLVLGIMYGVLTTVAQLTLQRAASAGMRTATVTDDTDRVAAVVEDATPMHSGCTTDVLGDGLDNSPVRVLVSCPFPNPLGKALANLTGGPDTGPFAEQIVMTASAMGRTE